MEASAHSSSRRGIRGGRPFPQYPVSLLSATAGDAAYAPGNSIFSRLRSLSGRVALPSGREQNGQSPTTSRGRNKAIHERIRQEAGKAKGPSIKGACPNSGSALCLTAAMRNFLDRLLAGFSRANADDILDRYHKDLPVADLPSSGCFRDNSDGLLHGIVA